MEVRIKRNRFTAEQIIRMLTKAFKGDFSPTTHP